MEWAVGSGTWGLFKLIRVVNVMGCWYGFFLLLVLRTL